MEGPLPIHTSDYGNARILDNNNNSEYIKLRLPFWDDFSQSYPLPDSTKWKVCDGVVITNATAISPPTINSATFDGMNAFGTGYSPDDVSGIADQLISQPIDLSQLNISDSVYISFFWQAKGLAFDGPDDNDQLQLQFYDVDEEWITVWDTIGGSSNYDSSIFTPEIVLVDSPYYFHKNFQFRFQSIGNLSDAVDTWHIDYILMDQNRSTNEINTVDTIFNVAIINKSVITNIHLNQIAIPFEDRALTSVPSSIFNTFTAIPKRHFFNNNPIEHITAQQLLYFNMNDDFQPSSIFALLTDALQDTLIDTIRFDFDKELESLRPPSKNQAYPPLSFEKIPITAEKINVSKLNSSADSLYLKTTYFLETGNEKLVQDTITLNPPDSIPINGDSALAILTANGLSIDDLANLPDSLFVYQTDTTVIDTITIIDTSYFLLDSIYITNEDHRNNDTVSATFALSSFYAYDDGTAESTIGISQKLGKVAYQYDILEEDTLTSIDIYFPNQSNISAPIDLFVWLTLDTLDDQQDSVIHSELGYLVRTPGSVNTFTKYEFLEPVIVSGTIYIGYQQFTDDFLQVGYDKNTNSNSNLFFNVSGKWEQNNELSQGSMMMRPRFGTNPNYLVGFPESLKSNFVNIYPNPSSTYAKIDGEFDVYKISDITGKTIYTNKSSLIDVSKFKNGIYILNIYKGEQIQVEKLVINK